MSDSRSAARDAVSRLLFAYAERVDAGDFAGASMLFEQATYRARLGDQVGVRTGAAEVREQFERLTLRHEDGTPCTKHVITNVDIDVDDAAGTARSRSYFTVLQRRPTLPLQVIIAGRYHDEFALVDGQWRFVDRLIITDLVGDLSQHLAVDPFG